MLTWSVKRFDCNSQLIIDYNVLKNAEADIKYFKKICPNKEAFSEALSREFHWRYWSKSEHELIVELIGQSVLLLPWCGCREPMKVALDVTDCSNFPWYKFAKHHVARQCCGTKAKIDIWDQLQWRWDELVDYCWYTRLPYERKHQKFDR